MLARDLGCLHGELLMRLDALGPEQAERELARWRALYALEHEDRVKKTGGRR